MNNQQHIPPPVPQAKAPEERIPAKFDQNDPRLQAAIADFVQTSGGAGVADKERREVPTDPGLAVPNPYDVMTTEALIAPEQFEITDREKALYIKAMLNDVPVRFDVVLCAGQLTAQLRSRTMQEQRRTFDVIEMDKADGTITRTKNNDGSYTYDTAYLITRIQQYNLVLMLERVNGVLFSECSIPATATADEAHAIFHKAVEKVAGMSQIRWTALLNCLRVFDAKCAKMGTEAANSDFWKPREQD
jgi:hypothetical protein